MKSHQSVLIALLLVIQALGPISDLCCELPKLPNLIRHFYEHRAFDNDSFLEFLAEDYFEGTGDEHGHHEDDNHDNLPFHGNHHCGHIFVFVTPVLIQQLKSPSFSTVSNFCIYLAPTSTAYPDSPFQPPKG